ncbi:MULTISPECIES: hypothetical protein [unclassified Microcoleus]|uniref:hypothetical protein n=1 Tax=unclassified Microcoleus TaxID=2642155 RepID=UPI002FD24576
MKVGEIILNQINLLGTKVEVAGYLILYGELGFLSTDFANILFSQIHRESILIEQPIKLKEQLLNKVPPYIGGPPYEDLVTIIGTLCESHQEPFPIALTHINSLILTRKEGKKEYHIEMPSHQK